MEDKKTMVAGISKKTLERLPGYYHYLQQKKEEEQAYISAPAIAADLNLNEVQVRKELALVSKRAGKPKAGFSVDELLARLRVTLRRLSYIQNSHPAEESVFVNGDLKIDYASGCVFVEDRELHLTPIEYKLLCLLAKNVGKVLTHTYLLREVWGSVLETDIASLRVFMATLRKKIETDTVHPKYIQTHVGVGYRMIQVSDSSVS